ncbi:MAG: EAL domain-containing protein [Betaproteobacteria bacterium]|nr:EAL domain-containing protein [Betaproteobacteria bacterium]
MTQTAATILIVDDEVQNRKLLEALLRPEGYRTRSAASGEAALAAVAESAPDLILLDVMMPGMDGHQVAGILKADPATAHIPIVMVTAQTDREARLAGLNAGAEEFLTKPVDRAELWVRVRNLLRLKTLGDFFRDHSLILERQVQERTADLQRFRTAMDTTADAIMLVNRTTMRIVEVNATACDLLGYAREEMLLLDPARIDGVTPAQLEGRYDALIAAHGESEAAETCVHRKDGSVLQVEMHRHAQRSGADWIIVGMIRDITERKKAADRIVQLNRVYAVLSGINTLIVRVRERDELFREACRIAVEVGGFRMALIAIVAPGGAQAVPLAWAGKDAELMRDIKAHLAATEDAAATLVARAIREKRAVVSNDSQHDPHLQSGGRHAESGVGSMAVLPLIVGGGAVGALALYAGEVEFFHADEMRLLTELAGDVAFAIDNIDKQERLDYLAYYDALTGLANRSLFLERVAQSMRSAASGGHKLAVSLFDVERFKNINDSFGQTAGDALLRQVAEWLTQNAGEANLVARIGADRFAVLTPEVRQASDMGRQIERSLGAFSEHPFHREGADFRISAKAGIALFPDDGAGAEALFRNAEAALKKAKASRERFLFYTQRMTETVAGRLTLENQLRQALDREEFVLHYQPKVNLQNGRITSAEALIRWNDPRTGLVPPGRFIPILEEIGLIHEVGRWATRQAIADYLRWRAAGLAAVRIAVNVSLLQLRHRGFVAEITQAIGVDARAAAGLELELTESQIMDDIKHSIATLQAIRAMGVTVAIDDFGTGFSSLSYLSRLPADTLKIDRSFVVDMTASPEGLALVSTIISLAHSLKRKVVAEGVETEEQSHLLRLLRCDEMQGFLFSQAVPGAVFEARFLAAPAAGVPVIH